MLNVGWLMGGLEVQVEGVRGYHDNGSGDYGEEIVLEEKNMLIKYFLPCIEVRLGLCRAPSYSAPNLLIKPGTPSQPTTVRLI